MNHAGKSMTLPAFNPATPLIALDIDGVLNTHDYNPVAESNVLHRKKVERLNGIIVETGAVVVLASAWRYLRVRGDMTIDGLDWLARSHGLKAGVIVGITQPDTPTRWCEKTGDPVGFIANERGVQIRRFQLKANHVGPVIAIDDLDLGITAVGIRLVRTVAAIGLTDDDARLAVTLIREQQTGRRP